MFDRIGEIVKKVAIIVCIVLVLYLIIAEAGLKRQPMVENVYDVIDYEQKDNGYSVQYKDEEGETQTILCKTVVEGEQELVRVSSREYWGFTEKNGTLILEEE